MAEVLERAIGVLPDRIMQMVTDLTGIGMPDPDNPQPPGPWDPVIRGMGRVDFAAGPGPIPWLVTGPSPQPWTLVGGPQPQPWRATVVAALAQAAVARAELVGDSAAAAGNGGVAGRMMLEFVDDWCGTVPRKFPWPWPGPRPNWAEADIGAADQLVFARVIDAALATNPTGDFAEGLKAGRGRLIETAVSGIG